MNKKYHNLATLSPTNAFIFYKVVELLQLKYNRASTRTARKC